MACYQRGLPRLVSLKLDTFVSQYIWASAIELTTTSFIFDRQLLSLVNSGNYRNNRDSSKVIAGIIMITIASNQDYLAIIVLL